MAAGMRAASATGSIRSASTTALTLPALRIALSPSGSWPGGTVLAPRACAIYGGGPGRDDPVGLRGGLAARLDRRGGVPFDPCRDQVQIPPGRRLQQAEGVNSRCPARRVGGQRHRMRGALAEPVHREAFRSVPGWPARNPTAARAPEVNTALPTSAGCAAYGPETRSARCRPCRSADWPPRGRQVLGELTHVAHRSRHRIVAVAVGHPALGDQQRRRAGSPPAKCR